MNAYMAPYVPMSPRATSLEYDVETIEKWLDTVEPLLNKILCILFLFLFTLLLFRSLCSISFFCWSCCILV